MKGYALHEDMTVGPEGRILQSGFEAYRLPGALDVLPVEIELHEGAPSIGPLGTKGAGEVPILNVGATIACAVSRAIGKPIHELPLTPPRVFELILDDPRQPGSSAYRLNLGRQYDPCMHITLTIAGALWSLVNTQVHVVDSPILQATSAIVISSSLYSNALRVRSGSSANAASERARCCFSGGPWILLRASRIGCDQSHECILR